MLFVPALAESAEETVGYLSGTLFKKALGLPRYAWITVALLFAIGLILVLANKRSGWNTHDISCAAMCIAISFVLSLIRLYRMPQGGSITPASMLPMVLFVCAFGGAKGLAAGCAYGLMQLLEGAEIVHPVQFLTDYPLAYGVCALACLARFVPSPRLRLPVAVVIAYVARYAMAVFSGTVFFASYAPEGESALLYSAVYNISYLGPDMAVCLVISLIPGMDRLIGLLRGKNK